MMRYYEGETQEEHAFFNIAFDLEHYRETWPQIESELRVIYGNELVDAFFKLPNRHTYCENYVLKYKEK